MDYFPKSKIMFDIQVDVAGADVDKDARVSKILLQNKLFINESFRLSKHQKSENIMFSRRFYFS